MRRFFEALSPNARVVLLGDADQLASVEAGAVFGDLCAFARQAAYSPRWAHSLDALVGERVPVSEAAPPGGMQDRIVALTESHRFSDSGGIGALAAELRRGDGRAALGTLRQGGAVRLTEACGQPALARALRAIYSRGIRTYVGHAIRPQHCARSPSFACSAPTAAVRSGSRLSIN